MTPESAVNLERAVATPADVLVADRDPARRRARERRRNLGRGIRRALLAAVLVAATGAVLLALRPRAVPVDVMRTQRGTLVVAVEESGKTRVKDRYVVSAPAAGSLSRVTLDPGDAVQEGDVLAEIAPALAPLLDQRTHGEAEARLGAALSALGQVRAQTARAAAAQALADAELARIRRLGAAIARQQAEQTEFEARMRAEEHASAQFAEKVAVEQVRLARVTTGQGTAAPRDRHIDVLAPVSGRVLRVLQKSAGVVAAGVPLVEVGDPGALEVEVDLLTTAAVQVKPGTEVVIRGWGGEAPLAGRVRRVEPSGFTKPSALGVDEQRVNVLVALTDPPAFWSALGDGYRVEARIVLWEGRDVVKAPLGAVFRHGAGWAVFRVDGDRVNLVPVEIGHRGDTEVEILSGLPADVPVVIHPGDRVKPGARVTPIAAS
ncbi:MAG TPA: HlyD family efflux transporter periplasmic adaptor subunit [Polyangia bacterium]|nr:HlyD family efflux transporter periplasmic adaptor subunit [Polyangia bacterium]